MTDSQPDSFYLIAEFIKSAVSRNVGEDGGMGSGEHINRFILYRN